MHPGIQPRDVESSKNTRQSIATKSRLVAALAFIAILGAGIVYLWHSGLLARIADRRQLIDSLRSAGPEGPLLCIGVQFVQVVIFIIPGEITQLAAGYVFGVWKGFLYSVIGIILGSGFNFYFARIVGRPVIEKLVSRSTMERVDALLGGAKGKSALFILFLIPGTPKDALCYGAGFSNLGLVEFCLISGLGRCPALLASIMLGAQASNRNYPAMIATAGALVLVIGAYYLYESHVSRKKMLQKARKQ
ncbi:MAG TPA: TVP38/TMEM64 family protein [Terriglobales bacterium]|nr:TVP38/TMEM64 family protein [Terriglobales bacterium]